MEVPLKGTGPSIACPWVPISSPLTHMVYLLLFFSYLNGPKSISTRPSDPDTMTTVQKLSLCQAAMIGLLDDRTYCVQSASSHLVLRQKMYDFKASGGGRG